ncbi:oxidoreductase [Kitasatospora sp. NPDC001660]
MTATASSRRPPPPWLRLASRSPQPAEWGPGDVPDLSGTTVVVTGGSGGIGLATAVHLARNGARVVLAVRDAGRGRRAADQLRGQLPDADVSPAVCDLADLGRLPRAADGILRLTGGRVDVLVNNACVAGLPPTRTRDGFEAHFGVNHLGHFALTAHLLPALTRAPRPRVVTVASVLHWLGRLDARHAHQPPTYHRWPAYCRSKLANLLFTAGLDAWSNRTGAGLCAVAAHPGLADTTLGSRQLRACGRHVQARALAWILAHSQTPAEAALPLLRAATDPALRGGDFVGPGGWWELRGPPVRVRAASRACRPEAVRRLWEVSERLSGVSYPCPDGAPGTA